MLAEAPKDAVQRIAQAIVATGSHETNGSADVSLVLDVDLSILGADPLTYDAFERAIRAEYAHVPDDAFRAGRRAILAGFHTRAPIFHTEALRAALEGAAHANLARAIAVLDQR
jgi:predicted metal-dependent HD superfamily phosphohydrolase